MHTALILEETIESKILFLRGKKVMLSHHLSELYEVETKALLQAVKRNRDRFPHDFMFQLTWKEAESLRSQIVTLKQGQHMKYRPYAFTEHGVLMLSSVLNSRRAIHVNIQIMRTFTRLREMLLHHQDLKRKIQEMEKKYNHQFKIVFEAIKELLEPSARPKPRIGFHPAQ